MRARKNWTKRRTAKLPIHRPKIPLTAQIVAAADVLEALASPRSYKDAWSHSAIRSYFELRREGWLHERVWKAATEAIPDVVLTAAD